MTTTGKDSTARMAELWRRDISVKNEHSKLEEKVLRRLHEELLHGFPNHRRKGCPDPGFLQRLAKHQISLSKVDPWIHHLGSCSDCFADFNRLRAALKKQRQRLVSGVIVTSVVLVGIGLVWMRATMWRGPSRENDHKLVTIPHVAPTAPTPRVGGAAGSKERKPLELALDLSSSQTRGSEITKEGLRIQIPARRVICRVTLPFGSSDGLYDVRIQDAAQGRAIASAQGNASIELGDVRLVVQLDLSDVPPGHYLLLYRQTGESWRRLRIRITG